MGVPAANVLTGERGGGIKRFRSADGVELVGDDRGPASAPVVVLMHGGGQTRNSWAGAVQALIDRGYRVINYDARGHGDSDWSQAGAYGLDARVCDLQAIVAGLCVPYALVGASLGGATAIHAVAAGLQPAVVVLVDIVPHPEPAGIARIVGFMRANPDGFATLDEAVDAVAAYNPDRPRPSDPAGLLRNLRRRDNGRLYWHWDPLIVADAPGEHHRVVQQSALALAARPNLPVLLVRGLSSDVVSDAGIAAFRALLPRLQVADVRGAGHMVAGDRNDAFNDNVVDFLYRYMPAAAT